MRPIALALGAYMTNCYIVPDGDRIAIVDAPFPSDPLLEMLEEKGIAPDEILLTHAHHDHVFGLERIKQTFPDAKVYVSAEDKAFLDDNGKRLREMLRSFDRAFLEETKDVSIPGGILDYSQYSGTLCIIPTPGHTPGSVSLYSKEGNMVLTGDTLFQGGVGRTDLGGDYSALMRSLEELSKLPDSTFVLPGHGGISTIEDERRRNPYMMR